MDNLNTSRLLIRHFVPSDWKDLYEYLSDSDVVKYEPYYVMTEKQCKEEAEKRALNDTFLAVCLKNSNKVIGNIYFEKQAFNTWEIGYVFNKQFQGMGYATESAYAVMDYAFRHLNTRRIVAGCDVKNYKSWRLLERLHMRRECHQFKNIYFKTDEHNNPIWIDSYRYAILADEWFVNP